MHFSEVVLLFLFFKGYVLHLTPFSIFAALERSSAEAPILRSNTLWRDIQKNCNFFFLFHSSNLKEVYSNFFKTWPIKWSPCSYLKLIPFLSKIKKYFNFRLNQVILFIILNCFSYFELSYIKFFAFYIVSLVQIFIFKKLTRDVLI